MKKIRSLIQIPQPLISLFSAMLLTFLCSSWSHAEDVEIYSRVFSASAAAGTSPSELNSNILFILDTSGSMDIRTPVRNTGYDPTIDYGDDGDAADDNLTYVYTSALSFTGVTVRPDQNVCQAYTDNLNENPSNPVFTDNIEQWRVTFSGNAGTFYGWRGASIQQLSGSINVIECEDDSGIHGLTDSSTNLYARNADNQFEVIANSTPRYNGSANDRRNPFGSPHTLVPGNYHDFLQSLPAGIPVGSSLATACNNVADGVSVLINSIEYTCRQRLSVMQEALRNSISNLDDVNVGLMRFNQNSLPGRPCIRIGFFNGQAFCVERGPRPSVSNGNDGGTILRAVSDINDDSVRSNFLSTLDNLTPSGNTPLAESMFEAYRYFSGQSRQYGENTTDGAALSGSTYRSPIVNECQDNNIVLLSDGFPTADQFSDSDISGLVTGSCNFDNPNDDSDDQNGSGGSCLDDLAGYMANTDLIPDDEVIGNNPVFTYTIGFTSDLPLLESAANEGRRPGALPDTGYFLANDLVSLEAAFRSVISNIQSVDADTFVAPAVTVNAFNRLQNREDLYFLVFNPDESPRWSGNLKRYAVNTDAEIIDADGNAAVADDTGFFLDTARSFWSETADGSVVEDGGAAEQLTVNRSLFANLDSAANTVVALTDNTSTDPEASVTRFLEQTAGIDIGQDGADLEENRERIARWTIGTDIDNERQLGNTQANNYLGETLHGTPYVLSFGTSADDPQDIVFFTSNQGILHAVNAQEKDGIPEGSELWGYIPDPSLLENLGGYYNRTGTDHIYGLDAAIAFNTERNLETAEIDKAYLFFGQRRGGNKYFAVDVTNADESAEQVKKLFTIEGGTGEFGALGQSWATPVATQVRYCEDTSVTGSDCPLRDVLIISGGYDVAYDDANADIESLAGNVTGNAIYVVDAQIPENGVNPTLGQVLWMVGASVNDSSRDLLIPEMQHSIPSSPTVLDVNGDGAADLMFAIDVAGKVFRIDFNFGVLDTDADGEADFGTGEGNAINAGSNDENIAGGLIADLSETSINRRFFNPLDVTLLPAEFDPDNANALLAGVRYALVTGSGYRAHPVAPEDFQNRFYVVYDNNITVPAIDPDSGEPSYLYAQTNTGGGTAQSALIDMDDNATALSVVDSSNPIDLQGEHQNGYFVVLGLAGEKVLSPTVISEFRAIGVSYIPEVTSTGSGSGSASLSCSGGVGNSRAIELNLLTGIPEFTALERPGITPEPVIVQILFVDPVTGAEELRPIVIIGTESFAGEEFGLQGQDLGKAIKKAWWEVNRGTGN